MANTETEFPMSALAAMNLSQNEDRIVHLQHRGALAADLFADCEGECESGDVHEYWGPDADCDGDAVRPWRVHLHGCIP